MAIPLPIALYMEVFMAIVIFSRLCNQPIGKIKLLVISILATLVFIPVFSLIHSPDVFALIFNIFLILVFIGMTYKRDVSPPLSIFIAILAVILYLFAGFITNTILYHFLSRFAGGIGRDIVLGDWVIHLIYNAIVFIFSFSIAYQVSKIFRRHSFTLEESIQKSLGKHLLFGAIITMIGFFAIAFLREILIPITGYPFIYTLSLAISFIMLISLMLSFELSLRKEIDIRQKDESLKNLREYVSAADYAVNESKKFIHDHGNLLMGFYEYINDDDMDGVREYYQKYMIPFNDAIVEIKKKWRVVDDISTPEIRGMLSYKLLHAQQVGITAHVDVMSDVEPVNPSDIVDVCRILGVFLDNAIEYCIGQDNAILQFGVLKKGALTLFVVKNTYHGYLNIDKISSNGYTTKGASRGVGLHTVSQILEKNSNLSLSTTIKNDYFIQLLTVIPQYK